MSIQERTRRLGLVGVAGVLMLAIAGPVLAHAELVRAIPADGSTAEEPVTFVSGRYSQDLTADSRLEVLDASGATVASGSVDPSNDRVMIARPAAPLGNGTYTVESTAISAQDGDVERVRWTFTVAIPASPSAPPSVEPSATAPSATGSPTAPPSVEPSPTPGPSPGSGSGSSSEADVLLPIIAALAIVTIGAGYLLSRGRRT